MQRMRVLATYVDPYCSILSDDLFSMGLLRPSLYVALEKNLIHMNLLAIFFNAKAMYKTN